MSKLIDGRAIAKKIEADLTEKVAELKKQAIIPKLAVILVGDDKPSLTYVGKKGELAKKIGIDFKLHKIEKEITTEELVQKIEDIQKDEALSGVIIQLPLPKHIDTTIVLEAVKLENEQMKEERKINSNKKEEPPKKERKKRSKKAAPEKKVHIDPLLSGKYNDIMDLDAEQIKQITDDYKETKYIEPKLHGQ